MPQSRIDNLMKLLVVASAAATIVLLLVAVLLPEVVSGGRVFGLAAEARKSIDKQWPAGSLSQNPEEWDAFRAEQITLTLTRRQWEGLLQEGNAIWRQADQAWHSRRNILWIGLVSAALTLTVSLISLFPTSKSRRREDNLPPLTSPPPVARGGRREWTLSVVALALSFVVLSVFPCACGHLPIHSLPAILIAAGIAWFSLVRDRTTTGVYRWCEMGIVIVATTILCKNVMDVLWLGHEPVYPGRLDWLMEWKASLIAAGACGLQLPITAS